LIYARGVRRLSLTWGIAVILPLWAAQVRAQGQEAERASKVPPPQITETSGLALGVVLQIFPAKAGVRADYFFQIPRTFYRFGIHAGVGATFCSDEVGSRTSAAFGAIGSYGHRHRLFVEASGGTLWCYTLELHGVPVASRALWGVAMQVGYEYARPTGFFARFGVGVVLLVEPPIESLDRRIGPMLTLLNAGYKLW
jgi:hypothetical protein